MKYVGQHWFSKQIPLEDVKMTKILCRLDVRKWTYLVGVVPGVQDELGVDDIPGEWENVERPVDDMVPVPGDVQAAQLVVAPSLFFIF